MSKITRSAFPRPIGERRDSDNGRVFNSSQQGMSLRFWAATQILNGLVSDPEMNDVAVKDIVTTAYSFADELIRQEYGDSDK